MSSHHPAQSAHTFHPICQANGGIEDAESGESVFDGPSTASKAAEALGFPFPYHERFKGRECRLSVGKHHRLIAKLPWREGDKSPGSRWLLKAKRWSVLLGTLASTLPQDQLADLDELVRYVVVDGKAWRWFIRHKSGTWQHGFDNHLVACLLLAHGYKEPKTIMGHLVASPWRLVNLPFQAEYLGDRQWNYNAAQYTYQPAPGDCPHWDMILDHCGRGLDEELTGHPWALRTGITGGASYLLAWAAFLLRQPTLPLPYLFLYSPRQNTGKSIFHEALALLMTRGVVSADRALTADFNGELANAVLAFVEEKNIATSAGAYTRIKDWVTSPTISIRKMHTDAYPQVNTLHFIHCANEAGACPAFPGDSRITMVEVPDLEREIPKPILLDRLRAEAPAFMHKVLNLELPALEGRLGLPAIDTAFKRAQVENSIPEFVREIAEYMADRETVTLTAGELIEALGPGDWPKTIRRVRTLLEESATYLSARGVIFQFPQRRSEKGYSVSLRRAV